MLIRTAVLTITLLATPAFAKVQKVWELSSGLAAPESTYYDPSSKTIFISNISGEGTAKDGNGWIMQVGADGKVLAEKWAEGLNAPKGMRSKGGKLWVSDIDRVLKFDVKTKKLEKTFDVAGAKFLNDVAIDANGNVYVSDTMTNKIHVIKGDKVEVFIEGKEVEAPNGLLVGGPYLRVVTWGTGVKEDWSAKAPGVAYNINLKTKKKTPLLEPLGQLDGIEVLNKKLGGMVVSDWVKGNVYRTSKSLKPVETLLEGLKGAADIGYIADQNLLLVPEMGANKVTAYTVTAN